MEIIALVKLPLQLGGKQPPYGGFAGTGYTRDHNYHAIDRSTCGWTEKIRTAGTTGHDTDL
jgi:hypothetical protein